MEAVQKCADSRHRPRVLAAGAYDNASPATQAACRTDQTAVLKQTAWIHFPYPGQWGRPTFSASGTFTMLAGNFPVSLSNLCCFRACSCKLQLSRLLA